MYTAIDSGLVKERGQNNYGNFGQKNGKDDRFKPSHRPLPADPMPNTKGKTTGETSYNNQAQLHEPFGPESPAVVVKSVRTNSRKRPIAEVSTGITNTTDSANSGEVRIASIDNIALDIRLSAQENHDRKRSRQYENEVTATTSATALYTNKDNIYTYNPVHTKRILPSRNASQKNQHLAGKNDNSTIRMPVLRPSDYKHNSTTTTADHSSNSKTKDSTNSTFIGQDDLPREESPLNLRPVSRFQNPQISHNNTHTTLTVTPTIHPLTLGKPLEQRDNIANKLQKLTDAARQHLKQPGTLNTEGINENRLITSAWSFMSLQDKKKTFALPVSW